MSGAEATQPSGDEPLPSRAIVTPRGRWRRTRANLPIERLLLPRVEGRVRGLVVITAPPGGGKTLALRHLRAVLPSQAVVAFFDADQFFEAVDAAASGLVILAAVNCDELGKSADVIELSAWTLDDCMEYLAVRHREQCASVLARLKQDQSLELAGGSPQILSLIMDEMANDPALTTSRDVLRQHIGRIIPPGPLRDQLAGDIAAHRILNEELWRWWRNAGIQDVFTAEWVTDQLCCGVIPDLLDDAPAQIRRVSEIAAAARLRPAAMNCLARLVLAKPRAMSVPMAASILLRVIPGWRPENAGLMLTHANLTSALWAGVDLRGAALIRTNFAGADLSGADISRTNAGEANFTGANLRGARLSEAWLTDATLWNANLTEAIFQSAHLEGANLTGAACERADFSSAHFANVLLENADFRVAILDDARLDKIDLKPATWAGASFIKAHLHRCNLEGLEMPSANFAHADLTGSFLTATRIPGGNFRGATLCQTGLAEIEWPNADLRDADFTHASFHLGSSRSGMVGSVIAGEGSRTGFYTDEFQEQNFKLPEEIRKACLCGANLLGAKVEKTDFYLVDLRGAVYSSEQRKHFARTGAILTSSGR